MSAFAWSIRVALARTSGQGGKRWVLVPTVFADVAPVFTAFVERVFAAAGSVRVTLAGSGGELGDAGGFVAAVFAKVGRHGGEEKE